VTLRILLASVMPSEAMRGGFTIPDFLYGGQPSIGYAMHSLGEARPR